LNWRWRFQKKPAEHCPFGLLRRLRVACTKEGSPDNTGSERAPNQAQRWRETCSNDGGTPHGNDGGRYAATTEGRDTTTTEVHGNNRGRSVDAI
jgi:hypothetical protein